MPRPILKDDPARLRRAGWTIRVIHSDHPKLGIVIKCGGWIEPFQSWSYALDKNSLPVLIGWRTLQLRKRIGPPSWKRKKRLKMPEGDFSLDEISRAQEIMEEL